MFPDPGEELFSSLLEEEERTPPEVFSDLSTVLLSTDLCGAMGGSTERWEEEEISGREDGAERERKGGSLRFKRQVVNGKTSREKEQMGNVEEGLRGEAKPMRMCE